MWGHFFPRTLLFCYNFFAKVISEDIWGSPAKNFWGWKPPKPPKTAKSLKTTKKGSEHASLDILKALILIIFSHFFQVGAVHTTPKKSFFCKKFFFLEFFLWPIYQMSQSGWCGWPILKILDIWSKVSSAWFPSIFVSQNHITVIAVPPNTMARSTRDLRSNGCSSRVELVVGPFILFIPREGSGP